MTTIHNLFSLPEVRTAFPVLSQAASKVGSTASRNLGTIGGNICHNEPGADWPPGWLALNALVELRSRRGTRKIALSAFWRTYCEITIATDGTSCSVVTPPWHAQASRFYF